MIVPVNQRLNSDFDSAARDAIARLHECNVYDYNAQEWVTSDHVHVIVNVLTGQTRVFSCGATLDTCEPYIAEAIRHYGLA